MIKLREGSTMKKYLRLALAQINPITGHLSYNRDKIISFIKEAEKEQADIVVFPELEYCRLDLWKPSLGIYRLEHV